MLHHPAIHHALAKLARAALVLCTLLLSFAAGTAVGANPVTQEIPQAQVVGRGVLTYAFWDVYEATLYAEEGRWRGDRPFALSIEYALDLKGRDIAERSAQEMRKQGFDDDKQLAIWTKAMISIFPDVSEGTVLTAIYKPRQGTFFYKNGQLIDSIKGPAFARAFFGIWLEENTSEPKLRRALLGL